MTRQTNLLISIGLATAIADCLGPEYYLTAEIVTYAFLDETYNETRARSGLQAAGFDAAASRAVEG